MGCGKFYRRTSCTLRWSSSSGRWVNSISTELVAVTRRRVLAQVLECLFQHSVTRVKSGPIEDGILSEYEIRGLLGFCDRLVDITESVQSGNLLPTRGCQDHEGGLRPGTL